MLLDGEGNLHQRRMFTNWFVALTNMSLLQEERRENSQRRRVVGHEYDIALVCRTSRGRRGSVLRSSSSVTEHIAPGKPYVLLHLNLPPYCRCFHWARKLVHGGGRRCAL